MNPSFKPPPPISDKQRETIYRLFWLNPKLYNIRKLSKIFNISLKRVTAIIRLKSLEKNWIKVSDVCHSQFSSFNVFTANSNF
jgi:Eukaryotic mitochondrial regulator protein